MKCFNHNEWDAVGICKNCGRGLCNHCAVDIEGSLACKNKCEDQVKVLIKMIKRNAKLTEATHKLTGVSGKFYIAIGAISVFIGLFILGLLKLFAFMCFSGIFLSLTAIFVVIGVIAIFAGKALIKTSNKINDKR